jgi:hypothetical protein
MYIFYSNIFGKNFKIIALPQASIHRFGENAFIADNARGSAWVGLTRDAGQETFHWSDNTPLDFQSYAQDGKHV